MVLSVVHELHLLRLDGDARNASVLGQTHHDWLLLAGSFSRLRNGSLGIVIILLRLDDIFIDHRL